MNRTGRRGSPPPCAAPRSDRPRASAGSGSIAGPSVTGALVTLEIGRPWGFSFFAAAEVLGFLAVPTPPRAAESVPAAADQRLRDGP
ncbi:hypothetical protein GCM10010508_19290 [Streptomyces naganishii JCM 4654]|uniref:Uncharacterized protein n=1 Tax=Streptomyces naganishii JCM 4654 TaxID=1306179 RepID=A0A918Y184_9ACTN|nr:hypothetical protein GCM10010508_19290 [Streptomyces naganishii JCM 4654]